MSAQLQQRSFNFDAKFGAAARDAGLALASMNNTDFLETARSIARQICRVKGEVTADDVRRETESRGIQPNTSAAWGALFKSPDFAFSGRYQQSTYISTHAREQRVWVLKKRS
jgi:hypothetical protein